MSNCSSQSPSLAQEGNRVNPPPPVFPWGAAHLSPCAQPTALARERQGLSHGCSGRLSTLLHPLVACGRDHKAKSPALSSAAQASEQVGRGQRGSEKGGRLKVTVPFLFCRTGWGLWHPIPAGSLPPAVNRHWAHTLAASSAYWIAAAIRLAQKLSDSALSSVLHNIKRNRTALGPNCTHP